MASTNWMIRGRHFRTRALRYRTDNDEDKIKINLNREPKEVIHEILSNVCQKQHLSEAKILAYLNAFVQFLVKLNPDLTPCDLGLSIEEILLCMRAILVQESSTVRSAGLRVLRHLLKTKQSFFILNKVQIPILIARSVDLLVQNHNERVQALQLVRHLLKVAPEYFPLQVARAVAAAIFPAAGDNDRLIRSCLAILCELGLSNPDVFIACGGVKALMYSLPTQSSPQIIESMIGVLVFLMNKPVTRSKAKIDFFCFVASFIDLKTENSQTTITSSCWCLLSLLRSWPGVLHLCNPNNRGLVSYVAALRLNQDDVRRAVLDLTFDLLNLEQPKWTDSISVALESVNPSTFKDSYKVTEEFVTAEGKSNLPSLTKSRINLIETHSALLLYCLLKAGLLDALIEIIIAPDPFLSIRATILLGEILHLAHFLLPPECCNLSPALPNLISYAVRGHPVISLPSHFGMRSMETLIVADNEVKGAMNHTQFSTPIENHKHSPTTAHEKQPTSEVSINTSQLLMDGSLSFDPEYTNISNMRKEVIGMLRDGSQIPFLVDQFCNYNVKDNGGLKSHAHKEYDFNLFTNYFKSESRACLHSQQRAMSAVSALTNLHNLMQKKPAPTTVYLEHIITNVEEKSTLSLDAIAKLKCKRSSSKNRVQLALLKECDEQIRVSEVLTQKNPFSWNWNMIQAVLKLRLNFGLDDLDHSNFIKNLIQFLKPSNKNFSRPEFFKQANLYVFSCCDLLDFLCETESQEADLFLNDFLNDVNKYLEELINAKSVHECFFNPRQITTSSYHYYFLFLGHLSRSIKGRTHFERLRVFDHLGKIALSINHEIYIKLVISTLDYSTDSPARQILGQVLSSPKVSARLYTTKYLHILLRTQLNVKENLTKWVIETLVNQLYDESKAVSIVAINALNEACDYRPYLEKIIEIKPSLLHLGDKGLLLLIRFLSLPEGFKYLQDANFVSNELTRWANHFNFKYVRIVESELQEAVSQQQRDEEGRSVKHNTGSKHQIPDVFVPPHLYSQLVQHEEGFKLLLSEPGFNALIPILLEGKCDADDEILHLKASVWALGHFGTSTQGAKYLFDHGAVIALKKLFLNAPVYTVRATAYYAMSMLATNRSGVAALHSVGWECVRHGRNDQWPLVSPPPHSVFSPVLSPLSPEQGSLEDSKSPEDNTLVGTISWNHFGRCSSSQKAATLPGSTSHHLSVLKNVHVRSPSESKADNCEELLVLKQIYHESAERMTDGQAESDVKLQLNSVCTNPSTNSSCDSSSSKEHSMEHAQKVAPNVSSSHLESFRSLKSSVPHLTFDQIKSSRRVHHQNILGYNTLKLLNWHRRPHLISPSSTTAAVELFSIQDLKQMSPLVRPKLSSKHTPKIILESDEFYPLNKIDSLPAVSYPSSSVNLPFHFSDDNNCSHDFKLAIEEPFYRGICLPLNLECIFSTVSHAKISSHLDAATVFIGKKAKSEKDDGTNWSSGESEEDKILSCEPRPRDKEARKQHDKSSCLLCVNKSNVKATRVRKVSSSSFHRIRTETESSYGVIGDEESPILLPWQQKTTGLLDNPGLETSNSGSSNEGNSSSARQSILADKSLSSCSGARKHLLKLIEQLFNPILYKACKQGLLHLKQLCQDLFQDICVYSDICALMSMSPYRAPARRLVQELFLDTHFNELFEEAALVLANNKIEPAEECPPTNAISFMLCSQGSDGESTDSPLIQVTDKKSRHSIENRKTNLDNNNSELEVILELDPFSEVTRKSSSGNKNFERVSNDVKP
ncbi:unnamed protein product [Bemisia tabaci]|uniref:Rapamycin-insensitive companion of mTOR n=1 Tax=Bemisia tabaci TaxID=7038 RepID=A0A9P0A089_BEMTA|nr:unnamed protein product [Bemisia tabaci]